MPSVNVIEDLMRERAGSPAYRKATVRGLYDLLLEGDLATLKLLSRNYVNATLGFEELGRLTGIHPKSLMRMLSRRGNPTAANLSKILQALKERDQVGPLHAVRKRPWRDHLGIGELPDPGEGDRRPAEVQGGARELA